MGAFYCWVFEGVWPPVEEAAISRHVSLLPSNWFRFNKARKQPLPALLAILSTSTQSASQTNWQLGNLPNFHLASPFFLPPVNLQLVQQASTVDRHHPNYQQRRTVCQKHPKTFDPQLGKFFCLGSIFIDIFTIFIIMTGIVEHGAALMPARHTD